MRVRKSRIPVLLRAAAPVAAPLLLLPLSTPAARAETRVAPRLDAYVLYTDNADLAPPGAPKHDDFIGSVSPGIWLLHQSRRVHFFLDYGLRALGAANNSDRNQVYHHGDLGAELSAIENWFFVNLAAGYQQAVINPALPADTTNLFTNTNIANNFAGRGTGALKHDFGATRVDFEASRGFVKYTASRFAQGINLQNSKTRDINLFLGSARDTSDVSWGLRYLQERVDYELAQRFQNERADAELGVQVSEAWRLIARGGRETDPRKSVANGGLDSTLYEAGFAWHPDLRNDAQLLIGHRFFGTSFDASLHHRGRFLAVEAGFIEKPSVDPLRFPLTTNPEPVPTPIDQNVGRITTDAYLLKAFHMNAELTGRVTQIALYLNSEQRNYVEGTSGDDRWWNESLTVGRRLGPRDRAFVSIGLAQVRLRGGGEYDDKLFTVTLSRQLTTSTDVTLSLNHTDRTGTTQEYRTNWAMLGIQMTFGHGGRRSVPGI